MAHNLSHLSIELWLKKIRTSGLDSKEPYGEELLEQIPEEIQLMILFLYLWNPKCANLTQPYLRQLLETEDVKLRLFSGGMTKEFLFENIDDQLIVKHHDPCPIFLTVLAYLKSLP